MKGDWKRDLLCCVCLYCVWAGLEEPRSWFCKQPSFSKFVKLEDPRVGPFRKKHMLSVGIGSLKKRWRIKGSQTPLDLLPHSRQICFCTVKHRLSFGLFFNYSSLTIRVVLPRELLRVNRIGKWWNTLECGFLEGIVEVYGIAVSEILYKIFLFPVSLLFYIFKQNSASQNE